jgi:hypothetical protein
MYNELERMLKEAVVTEFKVLSWNIPGRSEKKTSILSHDSRCPVRDLNRKPPPHSNKTKTA